MNKAVDRTIVLVYGLLVKNGAPRVVGVAAILRVSICS
jgi:hypothetical protein